MTSVDVQAQVHTLFNNYVKRQTSINNNAEEVYAQLLSIEKESIQESKEVLKELTDILLNVEPGKLDEPVLKELFGKIREISKYIVTIESLTLCKS